TLTEEQKDALQEWYDHLYQDALAANLGADWLDLRTHRPAATRASEPARPTPARAGRIALASSAVVRLGEMSVSGFTALTSQHREALQAWRADRTKRTTARVAFAIEQHFAVEDLERARRRTLTGSLASVAV